MMTAPMPQAPTAMMMPSELYAPSLIRSSSQDDRTSSSDDDMMDLYKSAATPSLESGVISSNSSVAGSINLHSRPTSTVQLPPFRLGTPAIQPPSRSSSVCSTMSMPLQQQQPHRHGASPLTAALATPSMSPLPSEPVMASIVTNSSSTSCSMAGVISTSTPAVAGIKAVDDKFNDNSTYRMILTESRSFLCV